MSEPLPLRLFQALLCIANSEGMPIEIAMEHVSKPTALRYTKELVLLGLVCTSPSDEGLTVRLTPTGKKLSNKIYPYNM